MGSQGGSVTGGGAWRERQDDESGNAAGAEPVGEVPADHESKDGVSITRGQDGGDRRVECASVHE